MKICVLGKYPPIEGGVSAHTYWLVRGLAERGHEIHVVTNADEVEDAYRLTLQLDDAVWYQPHFAETGGRVRVYNVEPFTPRTMGHIPFANPFVSKLASLATDVVRRHQCEAILAYYYEPYAVAGWLASRWTDRPLLVKHAGSDLDRLFRVPDLATTYKEILRSADAVVTQPRLIPRFLGMGVDRCRLEPDIPYSLDRDAFNPVVEPLNLSGAAIRSDSTGDPPQAAPSDARMPVIGAYGKIGLSKGTFDLIGSLGVLAREGLDFRFAAMIGSAQGQIIAPAVRHAGLEKQTDVLPMLPNWRVPGFLRACTAVCFLERNFPVAIHGPIIPREVLACGTCLVLSGEIASKQRYRDRLESGENVLIVEDPRDDAELAAALRSVIESPARALAIGEQGGQLSRSLEDHQAFVRGWEELLGRYVRATAAGSTAQTRPRESAAPSVGFESVIPDLVSFLRRRCAPVVEAFAPSSRAGDQFEVVIEFCDFVAERVDNDMFGAQLPKVLAALAYAKTRLIAAHDPGGEAVFAVSDRLHGARVSRESAWDLTPVRGNSLQMVAFGYDVSALGILSSVGGHEPTGDDGTDLATIEPSPLLVLFHRSANLIPCELRIDDATRELVNRCDGTLTTAELVDEMCRYFGAETAPLREEAADRVSGALDYLYRKGVLVFGEHRQGWGWIGGARGSGDDPTHALRERAR